MVKRDVGLRIAEIRTERGLTQADLAERMEINLLQVQRYEAGPDLRVTTLARIALALECDITEFFALPVTKRRGRGRPPKQKSGD
jgi:transcriptional regulator with XRE-family HTH domain